MTFTCAICGRPRPCQIHEWWRERAATPASGEPARVMAPGDYDIGANGAIIPDDASPAAGAEETAEMSPRDDEWARLLEVAVWGFAGEPQRCSRCGRDRFADEHSPTCPMPAEVIAPANALLTRLSHGRVTDRELDQRLSRNRDLRDAPREGGESR